MNNRGFWDCMKVSKLTAFLDKLSFLSLDFLLKNMCIVTCKHEEK